MSLLFIDKSRKVINYDNDRNDPTLEYVELGYMFVEKMKMFEYYLDKDCSFSEILKRMVSDGWIGAYFLLDEYNSISDPSRWKKTCDYLLNKKIILLDRDGVINHDYGHVHTWDKFDFIDGSLDALYALSKLKIKGRINPQSLLNLHYKNFQVGDLIAYSFRQGCIFA